MENHGKHFSPSKRRGKQETVLLKEKINRYEKEFEEVKDNMGTNSTEEIIGKFQNAYEKNFDYYKFINELFESLEELKVQ